MSNDRLFICCIVSLVIIILFQQDHRYKEQIKEFDIVSSSLIAMDLNQKKQMVKIDNMSNTVINLDSKLKDHIGQANYLQYPYFDSSTFTNYPSWQITTNDAYHFWLFDGQGHSNKVIIPVSQGTLINCYSK